MWQHGLYGSFVVLGRRVPVVIGGLIGLTLLASIVGAVSLRAGFPLVEAGALGLNALAFHLLVVLAAVPYLVARVLGSAAVYFVYSYPLWGLIFRPTPRAVPQGKGE